MVARINVCNWFLRCVRDEDGKLFFVFLSFFNDEAWFSLSAEVNSQNFRYCSTEIPRQTLHDENVSVYSDINERRITVRIFSALQVNSARNINNILRPFCRPNTTTQATLCFPARYCNSSYDASNFGSIARGFR